MWVNIYSHTVVTSQGEKFGKVKGRKESENEFFGILGQTCLAGCCYLKKYCTLTESSCIIQMILHIFGEYKFGSDSVFLCPGSSD